MTRCCFSSSPLPSSWVLPMWTWWRSLSGSCWPGLNFPKSTFHPILSFPTSKPVCAVCHPALLWVLPPRIPFALISVGLGGSKSNYKANTLGSGSRSMCDTGCGQTAQLPSRQDRHLQHTKGHWHQQELCSLTAGPPTQLRTSHGGGPSPAWTSLCWMVGL